jgi:hypothetical protein
LISVLYVKLILLFPIPSIPVVPSKALSPIDRIVFGKVIEVISVIF